MWQLWAALAMSALITAVALHPDHAGSKSEYLLIGLFILLSLLAVFTGGAAYLAKRKRNRVSFRAAVFVQSGQQIIGRCHEMAKEREKAPEEEAKIWADDVYSYLYDELGPSYAVRFDNPHGVPLGMTVLMPPYSHVEGGVKWRLARLQEIMTELAG